MYQPVATASISDMTAMSSIQSTPMGSAAPGSPLQAGNERLKLREQHGRDALQSARVEARKRRIRGTDRDRERHVLQDLRSLGLSTEEHEQRFTRWYTLRKH